VFVIPYEVAKLATGSREKIENRQIPHKIYNIREAEMNTQKKT